METLRLDRTLWPAVALLIGAFVFFEFTDADLLVQDQLYDFSKQRWLVDAQARGIKLGFYDLPKAGIIAIGLILLTLALGPERWRARFPIASPARRNLWVAFLTLGSVPALIGQLKATTNTFCPSEIRRYGGDVPYVKVIESYPSNDRPARRGRCFPAGHASGGFALLALAGIVRSRRGQLTAIGLALAVGWAMGFYQMAKGAHYLSHTVLTALLAWIGFLLWRRAIRVAQVQPQTVAAKIP